MKSRNLIFFLLFVFILQACKERDEKAKTRINIGPGYFDGMLYLDELLVRDRIRVDSLFLSGSLGGMMEFEQNSPSFYVISGQEGRSIVLFTEPGDELSLAYDPEAEQGLVIEGNQGAEIMMEYFRRKAMDEQVGDSLGKVFRDSRSLENFHEIRMRLDTAYYDLLDSHRRWVSELIRKNDTSIVSLFLLNQRFGRQRLFDESNAFNLMVLLDSNLYPEYPENPHVREHHARVARARREQYQTALALERLEPGKAFGEIRLPDMNGDEWVLEKEPGSPVFVHFWAAADAPSRKQNLELRGLKKRYPELNMVSISMDLNREAWVAAAKLDGLEWTNVSELLGMESPLAQQYLPEEELPVYYYVGKDGNIIFRCFSVEEADSLLRSQKNGR